MKSNDCSNQRLFGGLQIWRELRRCIEKYPRLRTGQAVHRSGPRGGGPGARQRRRRGGGARRRETWGARELAPERRAPRCLPRAGLTRSPHRGKPGAEGRRGWQGRPSTAPPPLGDFGPLEHGRYFEGPGRLGDGWGS